MYRISRGAVLAALFFVSGCATQPLIPYDHSAVPDNKKIGLLTPGWPSGASAFLASDVGQSFGLIGGLVDAAMQSNREKDLAGILSDNQVDANKLFVSALSSELEKEGYELVPLSADAKRTDFLKTYPAADGVDSYLDLVVTNYGYVAAGIGKDVPYRPWVQLQMKLVKSSNKSVLMEDVVSYNSLFAIRNVVTISPDPDYAFATWSDLTAQKDKSAKGVSESVAQTATAAAGLLK